MQNPAAISLIALHGATEYLLFIQRWTCCFVQGGSPMKTLNLIAGLLGTAFTAASGIGYPAYAQPPAAQTVAIHYGDLDLGTTEGRTTLDHRIRHAVRTACGSASPADLKGQNLVADCRADLHASLVQKRDLVLASAARRGSPATLVARR
jgi:UrcA family protein